MKAMPDGFDVTMLRPSLAEGWGLAATTADYVAVGFGSYHWVVSDAEDSRYFVTIDDLDHKSWLGDTRESAFAGLAKAFDTALALATESGLDFVVAPLPSVEGATLRRIGDRHAIAVLPFIDGRGGDFGGDLSPSDHTELVAMLAALHHSAPRSAAPRVADPLTGRAELEAALRHVDTTWHGGPYAEPARAWLVGQAAALRRELVDFDRLAASLAGRELVITHGEPHPGNVLRGPDRLLLIDWDTVALAPPERDLWMLATADGDGLAAYVEATGREIDQAALSLYERAWDLADAAEYLQQFRTAHGTDEDTEEAFGFLTRMTWAEDGDRGASA